MTLPHSLEVLLKNTYAHQIAANEKIVVGVSGGVDSMVLLYASHIVAPGQVVAAHVNHQIRRDSAEDSALIASFCRSRNIPFYLSLETPPNSGVEAWGRTVRYAFFEKIRREAGAAIIVTAHTRDDQVETILMRLLQKREPTGILAADQKRALLRPFLAVWKAELVKVAGECDVPWRQDQTNFDPSYLRNMVRLNVIPALKVIGIEQELLSQLCNLAATEVAEHRQLATRAYRSIEDCFGSRDWLRKFCELMRRLPQEFHWRMVEEAILVEKGVRIGSNSSKLVVDFLLTGRVAVQLPGGIELRRKNGGLVALKLEKV